MDFGVRRVCKLLIANKNGACILVDTVVLFPDIQKGQLLCPARGVFVGTMDYLRKTGLTVVSAMAAFVLVATPGRIKAEGNVPQVQFMRITAYASTPDETSDHPFITASGLHVRDGIVASNRFPFGTQIEIPALFGDKVFTVEDRMAPNKKNTVDIWMPTRGQALRFGLNYANVLILNRTI